MSIYIVTAPFFRILNVEDHFRPQFWLTDTCFRLQFPAGMTPLRFKGVIHARAALTPSR